MWSDFFRDVMLEHRESSPTYPGYLCKQDDNLFLSYDFYSRKRIFFLITTLGDEVKRPSAYLEIRQTFDTYIFEYPKTSYT
jgi:hypothetical protein